jgi:hypothetical protein
MNRDPRESDAMERLSRALVDEDAALTAMRDARQALVDVLIELRALGVPSTTAVHRIARMHGTALDVGARLRLAEALRKRAQRRTRCPAELAGPHRHLAALERPSDRALTPQRKEDDMGKLIKRTVTTEEFIEKDEENEDLEGLEENEEELEETEEPEVVKPTRRRLGR